MTAPRPAHAPGLVHSRGLFACFYMCSGWQADGRSSTQALDRQWCIIAEDEPATDADADCSGPLRGCVQDIRVQPWLARVELTLRYPQRDKAESAAACPAAAELCVPDAIVASAPWMLALHGRVASTLTLPLREDACASCHHRLQLA